MNQAEQSENRRAWLDLGWQIAGALFAVAAIVAIGFLFYRGETTRDLFEGSPCTREPAGEACADQRLEVAKAEPIRNPCASYQRVTSRRGRNCERFYIPQGTEGTDSGASPSGSGTAAGGGEETASGGSGGGLAPADGGQGGGHSPGQKPPAQSTDPAPAAESSPSPLDNEPDITTPSQPTRQPVLPSTVEVTGKAAGEVVDKAGGTVTGVVGGATDSLCGLTNSCGP